MLFETFPTRVPRETLHDLLT